MDLKPSTLTTQPLRFYGLRGPKSPSWAILAHCYSGFGVFMDLGALNPPPGLFGQTVRRQVPTCLCNVKIPLINKPRCLDTLQYKIGKTHKGDCKSNL